MKRQNNEAFLLFKTLISRVEEMVIESFSPHKIEPLVSLEKYSEAKVKLGGQQK